MTETSILTIETGGEGFVDITADVRRFARQCKIQNGVILLFMRHTSASLTIQENADPDVLRDLMTALKGFAPANANYRHNSEGPDDMPAHIKTMLTNVTLHVPLIGGELALGTWQAIYAIEHRAQPHRREIVMQALA
ncbi:MAG: secondary thiamine-phosphate synthase enzyme YjbQ [Pseudomonadota bacterium]